MPSWLSWCATSLTRGQASSQPIREMTNPEEIIETGRYSVTEACELIGVKSRQTLYNYVNQGTLRARRSRANGRLFFTGRDLKRFLTAVY